MAQSLDSHNDKPWGGIPKPEPLIEPEYAQDYDAYRSSPTPQNASNLLKTLKPIIDESLRSYAGTEVGSPIIQSRAKQLTLEAIQRYDPNRAKLRTHLLSHLRGLRRTTERVTSGAYLPEQWRLDSSKVEAARVDARDELGREPSDIELADRMGLPLERIRRARISPGILASTQTHDAGLVSGPDQRAWNTWVEAIYHDLPAIDQVILEHSFGLHGKPILPSNKLADMIKLSPGAISQRKARIQNMLDEFENFMGRSKEDM